MVFQGKYLEFKLVSYRNYISAIALSLGVAEITFNLPLKAQIVPDNTLGSESSVVTPVNSPSLRRLPPDSQQVEQFLIENGAIRDNNLFHSFQEFNINIGQEVNFKNPEVITNILTRVTGNNVSQIFGKLGVNGDANLFLINPNGIIFSEGADINLNGAFFASTAESIAFADGSNFSAVNPNLSPLLTISIPIGLQLGDRSQKIQAQKVSFNASDVTLIGGEIDLKYTKIKAPGGDVYLGSIASPGQINFTGSFPEDVSRSNINISDRSSIETISDSGGNITIYARNLNIEDSNFQIGIAEGEGNIDTRSGDIYLNVTEDIYLANSTLNNDAETNSLGNLGKISISARNLILDNSRISSNTESISNAGDIEVKLTNRLQVISNPESNSNSEPRDRPDNEESNTPDTDNRSQNPRDDNPEDGESINNEPRNRAPDPDNPPPDPRDSNPENDNSRNNEPENSSPEFQRQGLFSSVTSAGKGNGGNIIVEAQEVSLSGLGGIAASTNSSGNGGAITVKSDRVYLDRGATISANTNGKGNGGTIIIQATDSIFIDDTDNGTQAPDGDRILPGGIIADVRRGAEGNSGNIEIETGSLDVLGGAFLTTDTKGSGDGGNITITARESITVQNTNDRNSQIVSAVRRDSAGLGGNIAVETVNLTLLNGGIINAETDGIQKAGDVSINATGTVDLRGTSVSGIPSQILAQVGSNASGTGGNIDLSAKNLIVRDGGQISASTLGLGMGGSVTVKVKERTSVKGSVPVPNSDSRRISDFISGDRGTIPSGIFASSPGEGDANALSLETNSLTLTDKARISVSSQEQGAAGNLTVKADRIQLNDAVLSAETVEGEDANIFLNSSEIQLRDRSRITTNATKTATGGNIAIDTDTLVAINNSDITANAEESSGGRVVIDAEGVFGAEVRDKPSPESDITASSRLGTQFNGVVQLNTPDADPVSGLIKLPENFTDASQQIVAGCSLDKDNSFVVTGRGGLPTNPQKFLRGQSILQDWRTFDIEHSAFNIVLKDTPIRGQAASHKHLTSNIQYLAVSNNSSQIREAEKLVVNDKGEIELVVANSNRDRIFNLLHTECNS